MSCGILFAETLYVKGGYRIAAIYNLNEYKTTNPLHI